METIGKVAKRLSINPHTIRFYIKCGLITPKRNNDNNYQLISSSEENKIKFIINAKILGFTLSEIKQIFKDANSGRSACPRVRELLQAHIVKNEQKIKELIELNDRMKQICKDWSVLTNKIPSANNVCHLVESISD